MKFKIISFLLVIGMIFASCESLVDDINPNPNELTPEDVNPEFFLNGAQLANTVAQGGHLNRIAGLWSGQLIGFTSLYSNIYGYSISSAESDGVWNRIYVGIIPQVRNIREVAPNDQLLVGISKVMEAHAIGTAASIFGDVPYSQINDPDIDDPVFDDQISVFNAVIALLDDALPDLQAAPSRSLDFDIYHGGDATKWLETANTLRARYYLQLKDYANAYAAAQSGISSAANSLLYTPRGDASQAEGDKNLFWMILAGSRTGDIGTGNSHLMQLLDAGSGISRNNAKTDETARFNYYTIDEGSATGNLGVIEQFEPQPLISYEENLLILAEAGARTVDFATGLGHLNSLRQYMNSTGGRINATFAGDPFTYADYVAADFQAGGMENADNIDQTRALLREIVEERYVSGFLTWMPFNDARRLRKDDSDISVAIPFNTASQTQHPERMPYGEDELFANGNGPGSDPGIFQVTKVNQ